MIRFKCSLCHAEQETAIMVQDLSRGQKCICLKCGARLALVLVVCTQEYLIKKLARKG